MAKAIKFNEKMVKNGEEMIVMISSHVKAEAEKVLASGSLKFELPSVYPVLGSVTNNSGTSQFMSRTANCTSEIGEVIVTMNVMQNFTVYGNYGLKHGFETIATMKTAQNAPLTKMMGNTMSLLLEWLGGGDKGNGTYVSPFEGDTWEENGFHCVRVNPTRAHEVFANLKKMGAEYTLEDTVQIGIDGATITRMNGESTIDSDKKVKLIVVTGLPGIAQLADITQMGRKDMGVSVDWTAGKSQFKFDGKLASLADKEVGASGSYKKIWKDKSGAMHKHLWLCDFHHLFRRILFKKLDKFAAELCEYGVTNIQQFDAEEIARITNVLNSFGVIRQHIVDSIWEVKGWWQTASDVSRKEQANATGSKSIPLPVSKADIDISKEEKAIQYKHLSNRMRLYMDALQKVSKKVISPEDRIRLVWGVLLTKSRQENGGQIAWDKLSDFASSILPEEYALWVLDVMKDDPRVPKKTMDRIYPCGVMKDADIVNLRTLNGAKVHFQNGLCYCNGMVIFRCAEPIDDVFEIEIAEDEEGVRLFATHDIKSLIDVPAADHTTLCVYLQSKNDEEEIQKVIDAAMDGEVIVKAASGNPLIVVNGSGEIVLKASFQGKANRANNHTLNGTNGISGIVKIAKPYEFWDKKAQAKRYSAFLLLEKVHELK